jgi:hypothetical protein
MNKNSEIRTAIARIILFTVNFFIGKNNIIYQ